MNHKRRFHVVPFVEFFASISPEQPDQTMLHALLAEKDEQIAFLMQENETRASLLTQREEELTEAYEMIDQLQTIYAETTAKYRRLSAYLLKLELELRHLNRTAAREQPLQHLPVPEDQSTVADFLAKAQQKKQNYVLEQRGSVIYRVKKKG